MSKTRVIFVLSSTAAMFLMLKAMVTIFQMTGDFVFHIFFPESPCCDLLKEAQFIKDTVCDWNYVKCCFH